VEVVKVEVFEVEVENNEVVVFRGSNVKGVEVLTAGVVVVGGSNSKEVSGVMEERDGE
jgi:hypothetical protein